SRVLALMLDFLLQLMLYALLVFVAAAFMSAIDPAADHALIQGLSIVVAVAVLVGYPVTMETVTSGRTVGQLALGLRAGRDGGGPITLRHALTRSLVAVAREWPSLMRPLLPCVV